MDYTSKFLGMEVLVKIDRPKGSKHPKYDYIYPINYGFIPNTVAPDGEEIDAYILGVKESLSEFKGVCQAIIKRLDDDDDKLIVVPKNFLLTKQLIKEETHFQEQFFKSKIVLNE